MPRRELDGVPSIQIKSGVGVVVGRIGKADADNEGEFRPDHGMVVGLALPPPQLRRRHVEGPSAQIA